MKIIDADYTSDKRNYYQEIRDWETQKQLIDHVKQKINELLTGSLNIEQEVTVAILQDDLNTLLDYSKQYKDALITCAKFSNWNNTQAVVQDIAQTFAHNKNFSCKEEATKNHTKGILVIVSLLKNKII